MISMVRCVQPELPALAAPSQAVIICLTNTYDVGTAELAVPAVYTTGQRKGVIIGKSSYYFFVDLAFCKYTQCCETT